MFQFDPTDVWRKTHINNQINVVKPIKTDFVWIQIATNVANQCM